MSSRKLVIGAGLLLTAAFSVPAFAQPASTGGVPPYPAACSPASVPAPVSESAHNIYVGAKAFYDDANYDQAIAQFREAYKKDCAKHDLLIIISRAYELNRNTAAAIGALETYLERVPGSPEAAQHRTRIENLRKGLASQPPPTATASPTTPTPTPPGEVREHTAPPWILVGVGGAAVVTAVILFVVAPAFPTDCDKSSETCKPLQGENSTTAAFRTRQDKAGKSVGFTLAGTVTLIGGLGVAAGGLIWHFVEPTGPVEKTAKPKVSPQIAPGFAGLSLGGSF